MVITGYFRSREELGALGQNVPTEFPFGAEKLLLIPGTCDQPPQCCVEPKEEASTGKLVIRLPESKRDACGAPGWLVRVPLAETRPVVLRQEME